MNVFLVDKSGKEIALDGSSQKCFSFKSNLIVSLKKGRIKSIAPSIKGIYKYYTKDHLGFIRCKVKTLEQTLGIDFEDIVACRVVNNGLEMRFHLSNDPFVYYILLGALEGVIKENNYDISERNIRGKVVVDAGANIGSFAVLAGLLGAKKVYAFEPVKETWEILKKNVELNCLQDVIVPVNKALGEANSTAEISYSCIGDCEASLVFKAGPKTRKIDVVKIDDFVKEKIDFIKIDTEGYEAEVLKGAAKKIRESKPELVFSAYHKPGDKEKLPFIVKEIRDDYSCKLVNREEEDFHCE